MANSSSACQDYIMNGSLACNDTDLGETSKSVSWVMGYSDSYKIAIVVIGAIGIIDNLFVGFVIARVPALQTRTNIFVVNQAAVDFFSSVLIISIHRIPGKTYYSQSSVFDQFVCRFWASRYLMWSSLLASTYSLVVLTFERYLAIVYPLKYVANFTLRRAKALIMVSWVLAFAWQTYAILRTRVIDGQCKKIRISTEISHFIGICSFSIQYFIPLAAMAFAYTHIAIVLCPPKMLRPASAAPTTVSVSTASSQRTEGLDERTKSLHRARRNVYKTLCLVFLAFAICWTPNQLYFLLINFGVFSSINQRVHEATVALAYLNSCINPIIYALKYKQFRAGIIRAFSRTNAVSSIT
ncbi:galanin receptor 2a-like [Ptychodera flava]|uniref:galanin receptor 2a-like n=1 Tax=Ptychodera flava TaxID=63121 RepID=UPI003969C621